MEAFKESLELDGKCAAAVSGLLDTTAVEEFVRILENCSGRVLVSGIGKHER